ncbi:MAG: hypothetical protein JW740_02325 [Candidatus Zambryskibacteria bacterium]|nr:hypothetical protein [Candidatus Zambryskibacteria bacterium]
MNCDWSVLLKKASSVQPRKTCSICGHSLLSTDGENGEFFCPFHGTAGAEEIDATPKTEINP